MWGGWNERGTEETAVGHIGHSCIASPGRHFGPSGQKRMDTRGAGGRWPGVGTRPAWRAAGPARQPRPRPPSATRLFVRMSEKADLPAGGTAARLLTIAIRLIQPSIKQNSLSAIRKEHRVGFDDPDFDDTRFDVNLSILFTELPLLERPAAAAAAGFDAVELWWPWPDTPVPARSELDALRGALTDSRHAARRPELLRRTAPRPRPGRALRPRQGIRPLPRQHRGRGGLRGVRGLPCAQRAVRQPGRRRPGGGAGPARPGEPGPRGPRRRPDRGRPAHRGPQPARVSPLSAGQRPRHGRGRRPGQRPLRPRERALPPGPLSPVHERRGPRRRHRPLLGQDRPRPDRRQPRPWRTRHRRPAAGRSHRPPAQVRLRRLDRPGVQTGPRRQRQPASAGAEEEQYEHRAPPHRTPPHRTAPHRLDRPRHHGLPHGREPHQGRFRRHRLHP